MRLWDVIPPEMIGPAMRHCSRNGGGVDAMLNQLMEVPQWAEYVIQFRLANWSLEECHCLIHVFFHLDQELQKVKVQ